MSKPRIALLLGIIFISIFPVLIKMEFAPPVISGFYRMGVAAALLLPYTLITGKLKIPSGKLFLLTLLCGFIFALDVAVWNIAIQESTATQATLLTNLSPVWVGIGALFFLRNKPTVNFWIGTIIAILGMMVLVGFHVFLNLDFNLAFILAILSGMFYAAYMLVSKKVLYDTEVLPFITLSTTASAITLAILSYAKGEPFIGYDTPAWIVFLVQGIVCQLMAWLLLGYATKHMRATRVSVSLLGNALLTAILAWIFIGEAITLNMILGGIILLFGIRVTFYERKVSLFTRKKQVPKLK